MQICRIRYVDYLCIKTFFFFPFLRSNHLLSSLSAPRSSTFSSLIYTMPALIIFLASPLDVARPAWTMSSVTLYVHCSRRIPPVASHSASCVSSSRAVISVIISSTPNSTDVIAVACVAACTPKIVVTT